MSSLCFHIEAIQIPSSQHQWSIDETPMNHQSNTNEPSMKQQWLSEKRTRYMIDQVIVI